VAEIETGTGTEMIDIDDTMILRVDENQHEKPRSQPQRLNPNYPRMRLNDLSKKLSMISWKKASASLKDQGINWSQISTKLLLHHHESLCLVPPFSPSLEIRRANRMLISLLFQLNQKQRNLASRHHMRQPNILRTRNWTAVKESEVGAANEARATVAIIAGIENPFVPEGIVENETETRTLVQEKAATAMRGGVMIPEIATTSAVGIAENGTRGAGAQAKTAHALGLEKDGEQAIAHAVVVERGETVPVVAIGYVLQVLLLETPSSKNGS
jgi:hypothetical protein